MPMTNKCNIFSNGDDTFLVFQSKYVKNIKKELQERFLSIYDSLVDNKLSIHFIKDKTKSIFLPSKRKIKNLLKLEIVYNKSLNRATFSSKLVALYTRIYNVWGVSDLEINWKNQYKVEFLILEKEVFNNNYVLLTLLFISSIKLHFYYICTL